MAPANCFSNCERHEFTLDYVQRLAEGDEAIERDFSLYFGRFLLQKLRHKLRAPQAIEDVCQETFLRVLRTLRRKGALRDPSRLGGFVNSICNHVLWEYYRASRRCTQLLEGAMEATSGASSPESELIGEEEQHRVIQTLDELRPLDRAVLRLFFFDELDADEISRLWHLERGYVRVLLHRAKNRFREALSKKKPEEHRGRCKRKNALRGQISSSDSAQARRGYEVIRSLVR